MRTYDQLSYFLNWKVLKGFDRLCLKTVIMFGRCVVQYILINVKTLTNETTHQSSIFYFMSYHNLRWGRTQFKLLETKKQRDKEREREREQETERERETKRKRQMEKSNFQRRYRPTPFNSSWPNQTSYVTRPVSSMYTEHFPCAPECMGLGPLLVWRIVVCVCGSVWVRGWVIVFVCGCVGVGACGGLWVSVCVCGCGCVSDCVMFFQFFSSCDNWTYGTISHDKLS